MRLCLLFASLLVVPQHQHPTTGAHHHPEAAKDRESGRGRRDVEYGRGKLCTPNTVRSAMVTPAKATGRWRMSTRRGRRRHGRRVEARFNRRRESSC